MKSAARHRTYQTLLDVVLDTFEAFKLFQKLVRFPCVVQMAVSLPFDEILQDERLLMRNR